MIAYPSMLPLACVQNAISIIKNREIEEKKTEFAHCFWLVEGYVFKMVFGEPPEHESLGGLFGASTPSSAADLQEFCTCLEDCIAENEVEGETALPGKLGDGTFLKLLLEYAPQLIALIQLLLKKPEPTPTPEV